MKGKLILFCCFAVVFALSVAFLVNTLNRFAPPSADSINESTQTTSEAISTTPSKKNKTDRSYIYPGITDIDTLIKCIAMVDPDPFDSAEKADENQLLKIAFWCILSSDSIESFDFTNKQLLINGNEVADMYSSLFGKTKMPDPCSFTFQGICFSYDEKNDTYSVPITGITSRYTCEKLGEKQKGKITELTVGYIPDSKWTQNKDGEILPPKAEKTMKITVEKNSNNSLSLKAVRQN